MNVKRPLKSSLLRESHNCFCLSSNENSKAYRNKITTTEPSYSKENHLQPQQEIVYTEFPEDSASSNKKGRHMSLTLVWQVHST